MRSVALLALALVPATGFLAAPRVTGTGPRRRGRRLVRGAGDGGNDDAAKAAALRAEISALERDLPPPAAATAPPAAAPEYRALPGASYRCAVALTGVKDSKVDCPQIDFNFDVRFEPAAEDGVAQVTLGGPGALGRITRGFVWSTGLGLDDDSDDNAEYVVRRAPERRRLLFTPSPPRYVRWNVEARDLAPTVEDGNLYFNARVVRGAGGVVTLADGVVTTKLIRPLGIIADFKVCGTFDAAPVAALRPVPDRAPAAAVQRSSKDAMKAKLKAEAEFPLKFPLLLVGTVLFGKGFTGGAVALIKAFNGNAAALGETFFGVPVIDLDVACTIVGGAVVVTTLAKMNGGK